MASGLAVLMLLAATLGVNVVRAEEPLRVAVFPSASSDRSQTQFASALDAIVIARVSELQDLQVVTRPALDLTATEFALGCAHDDRECLSTMLHEARAQALIAASVTADGAVTSITLTYFDARRDGPPRNVVRRYDGEDIERRALDGVPDMLRELLRRPPSLAGPEPAAEEAAAPAVMSKPRAHDDGIPIAPIALAATGVVIVGVGAAFAIAGNANQDAYRRAHTGTMPEVDKALDRLHAAQDQLRLANIGFALGAAAIAMGSAWLAIDLSKSPDGDETKLSASGTPGAVGLVLHGRLGRRTW